MNFKPFIASLTVVASIIGMIMLYVALGNLDHKYQEQTVITNTIQPLDLTITYCESCSRCISHEELDQIDFEECTNEEIACLT